ncbi:hypothetical protein JCM10207_002685, partial [Rhodosporidiobolus poonsookiae]
MVRFALSALGLAALATFANAAEAPELSGGSVSGLQCDQYTNGEGASAACSAIFTLTSGLLLQGDSVSTNANTVVAAINDALGGADANEITSILSPVTSGVVGNLVNGVSGTLGSIANTITNATPQCKCDLSNCYTRLGSASSAAQAGL